MDAEKDQNGEKKAIVVGPWGGHGGTAWDDGSYSGVREITLVFARCIDSMRVVYDKNGKPVAAEKHGGVGGSRTAEIKLQFPEEFLTTVTGHYSPVVHGGTPVIRSLTFKSNKQTFGPFGMEEGIPFSFPMEGGQIVGFKGRCGWYLDSIGFYIARARAPKIVQKVQLEAAPRVTQKIQLESSPKVQQKVQQRFKRFTSSISFAPPQKDGEETGPRIMKSTA